MRIASAFAVIAAGWIGIADAEAADPLYGRTVYAQTADSAELAAGVADMAEALTRMTGQPFAVRTNAAPAQGILLLRADSPDAPANAVRALKGKGREPFVIRSGEDRLLIVANANAGLVQGLYFYLQELGCRWLMPGDNWTVIPSRPDVRVKADKLVEPAFRMRGFFGTGGFGPPNPVDPKLTVRDKWAAWKRRNRFGGEFSLGGHAGEAFSIACKAELEAHPEYRAMVNGQRLPWASGVKPCASNPEAVRLYVEDRLRTLRQTLKLNPDSPAAFAVSVEPSDGGGHCECPDCLTIGSGSVSDRVFFLANQVARAVRKEFPGRHVSLYAYNEHAAVPTIAIEPNVYVTVIPYGFQRTGLSGDDLLAQWGKKVDRMSLYTYWSIPDWTQDMPSFDYRRSAPERIRYWHEHGVEGLGNESTYSGGAMGPGWYVAARLLWDPKADDNAIIGEFYNLSFGPAAPAMQRMLERWAGGFLLTRIELGLSFQDLAEARRLAAGNDSVLARIGDYEAYVHYLRLWSEYQAAKPGSPERRSGTADLVTWLWRIDHTCMVHSFRLQQLLLNRYEKDSGLAADFDLKKPDAPGWKQATPPAPAELAQLMAAGAIRYPVVDLEQRTYAGDLVPLGKPAEPGTNRFSRPIRMAGLTRFEVEVPKGLRSIPVRVRVSNRPGAASDRFSAWDPRDRPVLNESLPADGEWKELAIPTDRPGRYRFEVFDQKTMFDIQVPAGVSLATRSFASPDLSPEIFFYVPPGLKRLAMYAPGAIPLRIRDGDGRPVITEPGSLLLIDVPSGQDGRVWSLAGYKAWTSIRMLNLPQAFAFFPDALLVPSDAMRKTP